MGEKWLRAPVFCALAQVRHNPIWQLADYAPRIQDALRQLGFSDATIQLNPVIKFSPPPTEPGEPVPLPQLEQALRMVCADRDRTNIFLIDTDKITYCTSEYPTSEDFRDAFLNGIAPVQAILKLEYIDQVGLRYLDAVVPPNGEAGLSEYLVPGVLGIAPHVSEQVNIHLAECAIQFQSADLVEVIARTRIQGGPIVLPPDLQSIGLRIAERFTSVSAVHAVLDTDAFYRSRQPFEQDTLRGILKNLRYAVGLAFDATITPQAIAAWHG